MRIIYIIFFIFLISKNSYGNLFDTLEYELNFSSKNINIVKEKKMDKTFSIIKPDATKRNITGSINKVTEDSGLRIIAQKRIKLTIDQAEKFYAVHNERPFFRDLVEYMTSEPVIVQVLSGENCVEKYRSVMGATNPEIADEGTIRKLFALNIQENSVHGSDSEENAKIEIDFFFKDEEIVG